MVVTISLDVFVTEQMRYNLESARRSLAAEQCDTKSNVKLGGFRSLLQASYVSIHTEVL